MKKTDLYLKPGTYIKASTTQGDVQGTSLENFVVSVLNNPTCCPKPSFIKDGMLMTAAYLDTSLQTVTDQGPNSSPLKLSTLLVRVESALEIAERLRLEADSTVTTQTSSVIQATTTNANLVISPNGTGALVASIPDGTPTGGGNARGQYAVDLKIGGRTAQTQVASGNYSVVLGGNVSTASGTLSIAGGSAFATGTNSVALGGSSTASGSGSVAIGGEQGGGLGCTASGRAAIAFGMANQATGDWSNSLGGINNIASSQYSTISGGQSNTASVGSHATVVGGQSNTSNGQWAISGGQSSTASANRTISLGTAAVANAVGAIAISAGAGNQTTASGISSVSIGNDTVASGRNSLCTGYFSNAYLYGQKAHSGNFIGGAVAGNCQYSELNPFKLDTLNSAATTVLSLDGTGVTNLIIPNISYTGAVNRMWNVQIDTIAVVTTITGTATGVTVGDAYRETKQLLFKRVGGTSSIVGTVDTTAVKNDTSMSTASLVVTAGASQEMALTFAAPTFSGGGSVTCRVVAKIQLVEVAY